MTWHYRLDHDGLKDGEQCPCTSACESKNHRMCSGHVRTCANCKRKVCAEDGAADILDDLLSCVREVRRHGGDGGLCDSCAALILDANPRAFEEAA